jgi:hypothetical protein
LPADVSKIEALLHTSANKKLAARGRSSLISRLVSNPNLTQASPDIYGIIATETADQGGGVYKDVKKIQVYPLPTGTITLQLWYNRIPPELVGDNDVPILPITHHDVIVWAALVQAYTEFDDDDMLAVARPIYDSKIERMSQDLIGDTLDIDETVGDPHSLAAIAQTVRSIPGLERIGNSVIAGWINETVGEVAAFHPWPWLRTGPVHVRSVPNQYSLNQDEPEDYLGNEGEVYDYAIPSDFQKPISLRFADDNVELEYHDPDTVRYFNRGVHSVSGTGKPFAYTLGSSDQYGIPSIKLIPTPDTEYRLKLEYIRTPPYVRDPDDIPDVPPRHRRVIFLGVMAKAYASVPEKEDRAMQWEERFDKRLRQMVDDLLMEQVDRPKYIVDVGY